MGKKRTFRAVIEDAGGGGAFVTIPFDVEAVFGQKRVKVKASIGGEPYRGSLVRMGGACHVLGIRKEIRAKIGKSIGDEITVVLEEDAEPRVVTVPPDLQQALNQAPRAWEGFERLSYSHQREYVRWITEAKRPETRKTRIDQAVQRITEGKKDRP